MVTSTQSIRQEVEQVNVQVLGLEPMDEDEEASEDDEAADDQSDAGSSAEDDEDDDIDDLNDVDDTSDASSSGPGSDEEEDEDEGLANPSSSGGNPVVAKKQKTGKEVNGLGSVGWDASDDEEEQGVAPAAAGKITCSSSARYADSNYTCDGDSNAVTVART